MSRRDSPIRNTKTAGRRVSATCMSIGNRVFMLRSILQEPSGLHPGASNWTEPHTLEFWYTGVDGKNNAGSDYCKTGYLMKKLIYPTVIPFQSYPVQQWVYIRLGEIYLNYAEALNEYGGLPRKCTMR